MDASSIIVIYGKRIMQMAEEACRRADLRDMILEKCGSHDARIAIKPNLLGPVRAEEGATTHPEIAEGVIRYLKGEGFSDITVMEGSWVGDRTEDSLLVCGYDELLKRTGVPFTDLQKDQAVETDCGGMKIRVCRSPLEADFLINLPVMKGHCQTRMTCALKNMKGCLPNSEKRRFHKLGLFGPIGHLSAGIRQDFILTDCICPDLTFEDGGNPVPLDRVFACADPVLNDAYCCRLMGLDIRDVPYIGIAERCGVGRADPEGAKIITFREMENGGGSLTYSETGLLPDPDMNGELQTRIRVSEIVNEVDSCSACYGALLPALKKLEDEGIAADCLSGLCIGQGFRGKTGKLGIGNCTARFEKNLPGCPPKQEEMYLWLKSICLAHRNQA